MSSFPPPRLQYKLAAIDIQEARLARINLWRSCLVVGCALSLGLLATLPYWKIKHQSQIFLSGNELVSQNFLYSALEFIYPQFIWTINSTKLAQKIESIPAVEAARIDKQIIPPKLTINLQERTPVAIATSLGKVGFLDIDGEWIPQNSYENIDRSLSLPKLAVLNYQPQYQQSWKTIYQLVSLYPKLKISEIQWNHAGNLFVQTNIGKVFLGADSSKLEQQFKVMSKLQDLPKHIKQGKIAYIDLSNPRLNSIQMY